MLNADSTVRCLVQLMAVSIVGFRSSKHVLSVKVSSRVAVGHAMLPEPVLAALQMQQHGRLQLQSISAASQSQPQAIILHPIALPSGHIPTNKLDQHNVRHAVKAWLAAQSSMSSGGSSNHVACSDAHVPLQTGTVMQLLPDVTASGEQSRALSYQLELKQAVTMKQLPAASYALMAASDSSAPPISVGSAVKGVRWPGAKDSDKEATQLHQQQAAMLSGSEALRKTVHSALQRLVPLLAFPCRYPDSKGIA